MTGIQGVYDYIVNETGSPLTKRERNIARWAYTMGSQDTIDSYERHFEQTNETIQNMLKEEHDKFYKK